jgi:hypothetical protein
LNKAGNWNGSIVPYLCNGVRSSLIRILLERIPKDNWRVRDISFVEEMISKLHPNREWLKPYNVITEYCNDINHVGTSTNAREGLVYYLKV